MDEGATTAMGPQLFVESNEEERTANPPHAIGQESGAKSVAIEAEEEARAIGEEEQLEENQTASGMHVIGRALHTAANEATAAAAPPQVLVARGIDERTFSGNPEDTNSLSSTSTSASSPSPSSSPHHVSFWGSLSRTIIPTRFYSKGSDRPDDNNNDQATIDAEQVLLSKLTAATHLVVLAHGLHGGVDDLVRVSGVLTATYGGTIAVLIAKSNHGFLATHEGVDVGGERLGKEVIDFAKKMAACHKEDDKRLRFSIIGHSLGGLYARYCIGYLYDQGFFERWEPFNFISLATPHLGSRRPHRGINPIISFFTSHLFSRTGRQLMLEDDDQDEPLLRRMCERNSPFFKAIALFRRRSIYANVRSDLQVPFSTAAIMPYNPYLSRTKELRLSERYGCILEDPIIFPISGRRDSSAAARVPNVDEGEFLAQLQHQHQQQIADEEEEHQEGGDGGEEGGGSDREAGAACTDVVIEEKTDQDKEEVEVERTAEEGSPTVVDGPEPTEGEGDEAEGEREAEEDDEEENEEDMSAEERERHELEFYKNDSRGRELRAMFEALSELEWERVGVRFDNFLSHVNIVCKKTILEKVPHIPLISGQGGQDKEGMDGINHIGFGVLRHLVDHFALADDERLAAAAHNAAAIVGGDEDANNNDNDNINESDDSQQRQQDVLVAAQDEKELERTDEGCAMRDTLATEAGEGEHGDDMATTKQQQQQQQEAVEGRQRRDSVDAVQRKQKATSGDGQDDVDEAKGEEKGAEVKAKRSSWKVWHWFSSRE